MCDGFVSYLAKRKLPEHFRFSTQTTDAFRQLVAAHPDLAELDSVVVTIDEPGESRRVLAKAEAITSVLAQLGPFGKMLNGLRIAVPLLPNLIYDLVAYLRPKAAPGTCPVPPAEIRRRMVY